MSKQNMPESHSAHPNVTPLIDVVMCLIIFFMLVAKIGVTTGAVKMELPETILGKKIEELGGSMIINVTDPNPPVLDENNQPKIEHGRIVRTHITGEVGDRPVVTALLNPADKDAKEIKLINKAAPGDYPLRRVLAEAVKKNKDFSVTIRAEKDLQFSMLQQVLSEVANGGVKTVNYAAKDKVKKD